MSRPQRRHLTRCVSVDHFGGQKATGEFRHILKLRKRSYTGSKRPGGGESSPRQNCHALSDQCEQRIEIYRWRAGDGCALAETSVRHARVGQDVSRIARSLVATARVLNSPGSVVRSSMWLRRARARIVERVNAA